MQRKNRITDAIQSALTLNHLDVIDESSNHSVPEGAQSHFKVIAVSLDFQGQTRIHRHKMINRLLKSEFDQGLHALSLHLFSPEEWDKKNQVSDASPNCRGGSKHD